MALDLNNYTADIGSFFEVLGTVFLILFLVVVFGGIMFYIYRESRFKIPVIVHKVLGDGSIVEYRDRAKKLRKNNKNELQLKKLKEIVSNPPADFYLKTVRGEQLYFRWDGGHVFVPQKVTYNSPLEFKPATYNILNQMAWRIKSAEERHKNKNFWELYGQQIMWVITVVLITVILIVMFSKLELVAGAINNHAAALKGYSEAVQQVIQ